MHFGRVAMKVQVVLQERGQGIGIKGNRLQLQARRICAKLIFSVVCGDAFNNDGFLTNSVYQYADWAPSHDAARVVATSCASVPSLLYCGPHVNV